MEANTCCPCINSETGAQEIPPDLIEVKCPWTAWDCTIKEAVKFAKEHKKWFFLGMILLRSVQVEHRTLKKKSFKSSADIKNNRF